MKCALQVPAGGVSLRASWSRRTRGAASDDPEFELLDTGVFDEDRYFDVFVEYAKADADDILIRITVDQPRARAGAAHLLPTLWFRNTWSWGDDAAAAPSLAARERRGVVRELRTSTDARTLPRSPATARRSCSSPRTRPTSSACSARRTPRRTSRTPSTTTSSTATPAR